MAGHSKWASIKHKKKATDAKRGQLFTKLARAIQVAAREGGGDPAGNAALATAIEKARQASMPKDNIERATFTRRNGNMGEPGSVAWIFEKKGEIVVDARRYSEDDLFPAIDAGADDINLDEDVYEVITSPENFIGVKTALDEAGVEFESAALAMR